MLVVYATDTHVQQKLLQDLKLRDESKEPEDGAEQPNKKKVAK